MQLLVFCNLGPLRGAGRLRSASLRGATASKVSGRRGEKEIAETQVVAGLFRSVCYPLVMSK